LAHIAEPHGYWPKQFKSRAAESPEKDATECYETLYDFVSKPELVRTCGVTVT